MTDDGSTAELARALRRCSILDPAARRQWLRLLPVLTPRDRKRLADILDLAPAPDARVGPSPR